MAAASDLPNIIGLTSAADVLCLGSAIHCRPDPREGIDARLLCKPILLHSVVRR